MFDVIKSADSTDEEQLLVFNEDSFEVENKSFGLLEKKSICLVSGYFHKYNNDAYNPYELINIVWHYYGGSGCIISCKSYHKPKPFVLNKPAKIEGKEYQDSQQFPSEKGDYYVWINKNRGLHKNNKKDSNIKYNGPIMKYTFNYLENKCNHKWYKNSSRNRIGFFVIGMQDSSAFKLTLKGLTDMEHRDCSNKFFIDIHHICPYR